jgi:hypothetical protein
MKAGFILMETLLSLGVAMGVLLLILPTYTNLILAEKRLQQEHRNLLVCQELVKRAETEPLADLSVRPEYNLVPYASGTAVQIINPAMKGLFVLR